MRNYKAKEASSRYSLEKRNIKHFKPFCEMCKANNIKIFVKENILFNRYPTTKMIGEQLYTTGGLFTIIIQDLLKNGDAEIMK